MVQQETISAGSRSKELYKKKLAEYNSDRKLGFCETVLQKIGNQNNILHSLIFGDEATFCLNHTVILSVLVSFYDGTLTGERCLSLLQQQIIPGINNLFPNMNVYFQQDGAPAHYHKNVLDPSFPLRCDLIGLDISL
nr:unnamed protein product [Callosobruchus analis]